ncbi:MAG: glycosyltransferase family 4 protein [Dehalococcoidia bacterium]|nr:glycosyltransferase family 4 protein [Dehalococcoidia bacterium]MCB9484948.1 glycosyltransferase family 4 protein [Thermoflexaceae bacterium]
MRICEINDIASVASELSASLRQRGHTVEFIQPRLVGGSLNWAVKPIVGPARAIEWAYLIRKVKAGNFDVVHIHYAYLGMLGVLGKFPFLLHCHGSDIREMTPYTRPMVGRALAAAGHVFYATPDLRDAVLRMRADAEFLPNPVDTAIFRPLAPASASSGVFLCSSLTDIKGAVRMLAACSELAISRPDIQFTAIAGGDYTAQFAALPNVRLIPHQPRAQLPHILSGHGVVLGQVFLGALGMAELEAMATARPVVAWFRFDNAYAEPPPMVRSVDGRDLAAAIARLVDDPEARDDLGRRARAWVERNHSLDAAARAVETAATAVVSRRSLEMTA